MPEIVCQDKLRIPAYPQGSGAKGDILFLKREYPPYTPKRKDEGPYPSTPHIGSLGLEELHALRNRVRCTWLRHEPLLFDITRNRALLP